METMEDCRPGWRVVGLVDRQQPVVRAALDVVLQRVGRRAAGRTRASHRRPGRLGPGSALSETVARFEPARAAAGAGLFWPARPAPGGRRILAAPQRRDCLRRSRGDGRAAARAATGLVRRQRQLSLRLSALHLRRKRRSRVGEPPLLQLLSPLSTGGDGGLLHLYLSPDAAGHSEGEEYPVTRGGAQ